MQALQNGSPQSFFDGREHLRTAFLSGHGLAEAAAALTAEDWAARRFWRLEQNGQSMILMESVPDNHPLSTPDHKIRDTLRITNWLQSIGIHAPAIHAADEDNGFILMEDVGTQSLPLNRDAYQCAGQVLATIRNNYNANHLSLPDFGGSRIDMAKRRIIDWLLPVIRGEQNEGGEGAAYMQVWDSITASLPDCPKTFLHIDYHADNIMWQQQAQGLARCALLDFQGAYYGPLPYDAANLLEDIRRDIPDDIRNAVLTAYCDGMDAQDKENFDIWYRTLALQFHCRIAGQLLRMYKAKGKDRYIEDYLPRTLKYIDRALQQEQFKALAELFVELDLKVTNTPLVTLDRINALVASDAY